MRITIFYQGGQDDTQRFNGKDTPFNPEKTVVANIFAILKTIHREKKKGKYRGKQSSYHIAFTDKDMRYIFHQFESITGYLPEWSRNVHSLFELILGYLKVQENYHELNISILELAAIPAEGVMVASESSLHCLNVKFG